jgi:hypothetical protein
MDWRDRVGGACARRGVSVRGGRGWKARENPPSRRWALRAGFLWELKFRPPKNLAAIF